MRTLARDDETDVACPVLSLSERLDDSTLVETARSKSQDHLFAISRRQSLSQVVTDVLVERGDTQVLLSVAGNAGALFSQRGYECLVGRAEGNDSLAERIGRRKDIPPKVFALLIRTASERVHDALGFEGRAGRKLVRNLDRHRLNSLCRGRRFLGCSPNKKPGEPMCQRRVSNTPAF